MCSKKCFIAFPLLFVFLTAVGFFITYGWSVSNENVEKLPDWPFVSDTGGNPPESCLFTLLLTWAAIFNFISMCLYYQYIKHKGVETKANGYALAVGCICCFGMTVVAAFQFPVQEIIHLAGAGLAFGGAIVYSWMVVHISRKYDSSKKLLYVRVGVATLDTISFCVLLVVYNLWMSDTLPKKLPAITEWLLIYLAILFMSTLVYELRYISKVKILVGLLDGDEENGKDGVELHSTRRIEGSTL